MAFLLIYILINLLFSVSLERRKWRVATVLHAVAFALIGLLLLFAASEGTILELALRRLFPDSYDVLAEVLQTEATAAAPILVTEWIVLFAALAAGAVRVVEAAAVSVRRADLSREGRVPVRRSEGRPLAQLMA